MRNDDRTSPKKPIASLESRKPTEVVFEGPTFTYEDDRYNYAEQRWVTLGFLKGLFVAIAHTETQSEIRIISMRGGTKYEQSIFFENL